MKPVYLPMGYHMKEGIKWTLNDALFFFYEIYFTLQCQEKKHSIVKSRKFIGLGLMQLNKCFILVFETKEKVEKSINQSEIVWMWFIYYYVHSFGNI